MSDRASFPFLGTPASQNMGCGPAFLGVERSVTGRRWQARSYDERAAFALAQRYELPDLLARGIAARGIGLDEAEAFLSPRLRDSLPDPSRFKDMDQAATLFVEAVTRGEPIAVFGDYDVDGATSAALLLRFGRALGAAFRLYVPDRLREGYGPNAEAMRTLAGEGIKLVICVDCGATAHEPLAAARAAGLRCIVLDHHATEANLPPADALVNPNRLDEDGSYGMLAAVGVTYLFAIAANRALRMAGFYNDARPEPDLLAWLDIVALGTVCDVVKLVGLNRAFVAQGLKVMAARRNLGLVALAQAAGARAWDAYTLGFLLGPRVNAGGRVGQSDLGARLLSTENPDEAAALAQRLNELNAERREIEAQVLREAEALTLAESSVGGGSTGAAHEAALIFVASEHWHPGVIGIVASRLKDKFQRPSLVIALEGDIGKGSGRSIGSVDLGAQVIAARQAGLLLNGGGHKMAAGLTVARDKLAALQAFLSERIGKQLAAEPLVATLTLDGLAAGPALTPDFVRRLEALGPFGTGNSEPRFALADCALIRADIVGEKHVSVIFAQGGARLRGIAFRAMESGLGQALLTNKRLHLAGHIRRDEWQGVERTQLHIADAAIINGA